MAKIHEISKIRARQIKLAKLKEIFGKYFHRVAIPLCDVPSENLDYIIPGSLLRSIDELNLAELDDLLNGHQKFFIRK